MPASPPASTVFESRARCSPNWTRFEGGQDFIGHCEEPTGPAFGGPGDKLRGEAITLPAAAAMVSVREPSAGGALGRPAGPPQRGRGGHNAICLLAPEEIWR